VSSACLSRRAPITNLVEVLRRDLSMVIDETGLTGPWDFAISFDSGALGRGPSVRQQFVSDLPSLFDAVQQQLGLTLKRERRSMEGRIISAVHEPTPN
jgi:uncharacterized protein (TIGR03435 family)